MMEEIGSVTGSDGVTLLKMWRASVPSGERVLQRHSHICFEITSVNSGGGVYTVGGRQYPMRPGDMFVFGSNEQHCITDVSENGLEITNLHFEPRYLWGGSADSLSAENINICFAHNESFENRIEADKAQPVLSFFNQIAEELEKQRKEYFLLVKSLLNIILVTLIRRFDYTGGKAAVISDRLHCVRRVIRYIDMHLTEELTLGALAEIAGTTPNYFSSVFHEVVGITLWEYISSRRIDEAVRRLTADDGKSVLEIALSCGFNNTANFNKAFKKITGMTPKQCRELGGTFISI